MKIVALLAVRNEALYMERCLDHLYSQGIETCVIDNESTDNTVEIAESFRDRGVCRIERLPYRGRYQWSEILEFKEQLAREMDADWFIHHDADEIRHAPNPYRTLCEGIGEADRQGYNAINFDEFVFVPSSHDESFENNDYVAEMKYYYFFEPYPLRRVNAWRRQSIPIDLRKTGGHSVEFEGRRVFPVHFVLRHYIALSRQHALRKYAGRVYSADEVINRKWHGTRVSFRPDQFQFPAPERLKMVTRDNAWDKSEPWMKHDFLEKAQSGAAENLQNVKEKASWTAKLFSRFIKKSSESYRPMPVIVGVSRSGTTLLRLMLDAHPELAIPPETHFVPSLLTLENKFFGRRRRFYKIITKAPNWFDFHLREDLLLESLGKIRPFTVAEGVRCFYKLYAERFHKKRWGDKTPYYNLHMAAIQKILPEAHFIHVVRDGRDVALSLRNLWFGPGNDIEAQAVDWLWRIREARQQAQLCRHYIEIRHEDLLADSINTLKRICNFIDIPYDSAMERYYEGAQERINELTDWRSAEGEILVKKEQHFDIHKRTLGPPDQSRVGRWKREMSVEDRVKFEKIAGEMLRDLGYETQT